MNLSEETFAIISAIAAAFTVIGLFEVNRGGVAVC